MEQIEKLVLTIFGGILTLAIISVIISRKSAAPEVISATSTGLSNVIAAAVNPQSTAMTNGDLGSSSFSTPAGADIFGSIMGGQSLSSIAENQARSLGKRALGSLGLFG